MFLEVTYELWQGFQTSLLLFVLTLVISLPLGLVMMFALRSSFKPLAWLMNIIIWIIRGTPLMLQLLIVFFAPGLLFGATVFANHRFLAALLTFGVNYAGYYAEIYRGGIEGIPRGQFEAGKVLGLTRWQTFSKVILLQIVKHILAPMGNEIITLVKDTSLVRVIAVIELIKVAERYTSRGVIWPLFYTGIFYLIFSAILTWLLKRAEKRLSYFEVA